MANDLQIEKVSNQEIRILLGPGNSVKANPVTAQELYTQLGKYLQSLKNPRLDTCIIDY